eukprot:gene20954-biopygen7049
MHLYQLVNLVRRVFPNRNRAEIAACDFSLLAAGNTIAQHELKSEQVCVASPPNLLTPQHRPRDANFVRLKLSDECDRVDRRERVSLVKDSEQSSGMFSNAIGCGGTPIQAGRDVFPFALLGDDSSDCTLDLENFLAFLNKNSLIINSRKFCHACHVWQ